MLYTIGHSNHTINKFLSLLLGFNINILVDVRSTPYSKYNPQFNQHALTESLNQINIHYVYLGKVLGGRTADSNLLDSNGVIDYFKVAETPMFVQGVNSLLSQCTNNNSVAMMCSEKEPLDCHRTLLVSHALHQKGILVTHIHADYTSETHDDAMKRLLTVTKSDNINEAIRKRSLKVAYRVKIN